MIDINYIQTIGISGGFGFTSVSLWLMARQTREATRTTKAAVYQDIMSAMRQVNQNFVDYPELVPYFYERKEVTSDPQQKARIMQMAGMYLNLMDSVQSQAPNMPRYPWAPWAIYFREIYTSSPAIKEYLDLHEQWYPELSRWLKSTDRDILKDFWINA